MKYFCGEVYPKAGASIRSAARRAGGCASARTITRSTLATLRTPPRPAASMRGPMARAARSQLWNSYRGGLRGFAYSKIWFGSLKAMVINRDAAAIDRRSDRVRGRATTRA